MSQAVGAGVVAHGRRRVREEHREQPGRPRDLHRPRARRRAQPLGQRLRGGGEADVGVLVEQLERRAPGGDGERVPAQRAGLVDVAGRRDAAHELDRAAVGGRGQAAADDLAHDREVGQHARELLGAAGADPEARDDLVEDEQRRRAPWPARAAARGSRARAGRGPCWPGTARRAARRSACSANAARTALRVVPGHDHRAARGRLRHAGRRRDALRGQPGAGLREQAVDVAVVGAGELQQRLAPGGRAGEPDRAHGRLGARRRHAQHVDGGHALRDELGELDLAGRRRAVARAAAGGLRAPPRPPPGARARG